MDMGRHLLAAKRISEFWLVWRRSWSVTALWQSWSWMVYRKVWSQTVKATITDWYSEVILHGKLTSTNICFFIHKANKRLKVPEAENGAGGAGGALPPPDLQTPGLRLVKRPHQSKWQDRVGVLQSLCVFIVFFLRLVVVVFTTPTSIYMWAPYELKLDLCSGSMTARLLSGLIEISTHLVHCALRSPLHLAHIGFLFRAHKSEPYGTHAIFPSEAQVHSVPT